MCTPVQQLFSRPIPEKVWHYTSLEALEGILASGRMWATDARFTNDRTEFIHARDIAATCIQTIEATGELHHFPARNLRQMLDYAFEEGPLSPLRNAIYLVSFSEASDLLAQWMQYSCGGTGVSIAFDLGHIRPPEAAGVAVTFAPCVYAADEKERLVRCALSRFTDTVGRVTRRSRNRNWVEVQLKGWKLVNRIQGLSDTLGDFAQDMAAQMRDELISAWTETLFDLLRVASHCKQGGFLSEREWRLALPRPVGRVLPEHDPVKFRGPRGNIPYFESTLFQQGQLPITEIMTGPLCTDTQRIRNVMQANGYNCAISASGIPYRDTRAL